MLINVKLLHQAIVYSVFSREIVHRRFLRNDCPDQNKNESHNPDKMTPDVHCLIVAHAERPAQSPSAVEVNPIPSEYVFIVPKPQRSPLYMSDEML
jgi:hypothetical protein